MRDPLDWTVPATDEGPLAGHALLPAGGVPAAQGGRAGAGLPPCGVRPSRPQLLPCRTASHWRELTLSLPPPYNAQVSAAPVCEWLWHRSPRGFWRNG